MFPTFIRTSLNISPFLSWPIPIQQQALHNHSTATDKGRKKLTHASSKRSCPADCSCCVTQRHDSEESAIYPAFLDSQPWIAKSSGFKPALSRQYSENFSIASLRRPGCQILYRVETSRKKVEKRILLGLLDLPPPLNETLAFKREREKIKGWKMWSNEEDCLFFFFFFAVKCKMM